MCDRPSSDKSPDNKVHGANMGPFWGRQDPGGPHVGPMNFVIWVIVNSTPVERPRKNLEWHISNPYFQVILYSMI